MVREFELRFAPWTTSSRNSGVATFQGQNGGGTLVPARQGSGRLSLWCCAITYASMYLCRSVSQAEIGRNRCGCVWVRVEPWRSRVRRARRKQRRPSRADWQQREGCHLASGRGSRPGLAQSLLLKSWRRPDRQESACVRARRARRSSGVSAVGPINDDVILCYHLSRVQLHQESANIQAVRAAGAFLCNFVSVHCSSSTSVRRECE